MKKLTKIFKKIVDYRINIWSNISKAKSYHAHVNTQLSDSLSDDSKTNVGTTEINKDEEGESHNQKQSTQQEESQQEESQQEESQQEESQQEESQQEESQQEESQKADISSTINRTAINTFAFIKYQKLSLVVVIIVLTSLIIAIIGMHPIETIVSKNLFYSEYLEDKYNVIEMTGDKDDNYIKSFAAEYVLRRENIVTETVFESNIEWVTTHTTRNKDNEQSLLNYIDGVYDNFFSRNALVSRGINILGIRILKATKNNEFFVEVDVSSRDSLVYYYEIPKTRISWKNRTISIKIVPSNIIIRGGLENISSLGKEVINPIYLVDEYEIQETREKSNITEIDGIINENVISDQVTLITPAPFLR